MHACIAHLTHCIQHMHTPGLACKMTRLLGSVILGSCIRISKPQFSNVLGCTQKLANVLFGLEALVIEFNEYKGPLFNEISGG